MIDEWRKASLACLFATVRNKSKTDADYAEIKRLKSIRDEWAEKIYLSSSEEDFAIVLDTTVLVVVQLDNPDGSQYLELTEYPIAKEKQ